MAGFAQRVLQQLLHGRAFLDDDDRSPVSGRHDEIVHAHRRLRPDPGESSFARRHSCE